MGNTPKVEWLHPKPSQFEFYPVKGVDTKGVFHKSAGLFPPDWVHRIRFLDGTFAKKEQGLEHSKIADREQIDRTYSAAAAAVDSDFAGMT